MTGWLDGWMTLVLHNKYLRTLAAVTKTLMKNSLCFVALTYTPRYPHTHHLIISIDGVSDLFRFVFVWLIFGTREVPAFQRYTYQMVIINEHLIRFTLTYKTFPGSRKTSLITEILLFTN